MKRKLILNIFAVLLAVAMLLPLAACAPTGQSSVGTTEETPTVATEEPARQPVPQGDLTELVSAQLWSVNNQMVDSLREVALNADGAGEWFVPICRVGSKEELAAFQPEEELRGYLSGDTAFYELMLGVDETLFEENDILMVSFMSSSGSYEYEFMSLTRQEDRLVARFMQIYPGKNAMVTADIECWLALLAVPKNALLYLTEYDVILDYEDSFAEATEKRGAPIQHTEAMLALQAKCRKYDEKWMFKLAFIFSKVYKNDRVLKGDTYSILLHVRQETSDETVREMVRLAGIEEEVQPISVGKVKLCRFYATAEQLEALARNNVEQIVEISYLYLLQSDG